MMRTIQRPADLSSGARRLIGRIAANGIAALQMRAGLRKPSARRRRTRADHPSRAARSEVRVRRTRQLLVVHANAAASFDSVPTRRPMGSLALSRDGSGRRRVDRCVPGPKGSQGVSARRRSASTGPRVWRQFAARCAARPPPNAARPVGAAVRSSVPRRLVAHGHSVVTQPRFLALPRARRIAVARSSVGSAGADRPDTVVRCSAALTAIASSSADA